MENEKCDLIHPNGVKEKKLEVIDGYTINHTKTPSQNILSIISVIQFKLNYYLGQTLWAI